MAKGKPTHIAAIVAGTGFHHPDAIRRKCREGMSIALVREPRNRFDANAIAVYMLSPFLFFSFRTHIGYLKAPLAKRLAPKMDAGAKCEATVTSFYADLEHPRVSLSIRVSQPAQ